MRRGLVENSGRGRERLVPIRFTEPASTFFRLIPVHTSKKSDKPGARESRRNSGGFTLLELMLVITIIAVLAGMAMPRLRGLSKSNAMQAATRQLLDDVAAARQRALSEHTAVYMVFLHESIRGTVLNPNDNQIAYNGLSPKAKATVDGLLPNQLRGYALLALRSAGDQPGQPYPHYLTDWRALPEGVYIATNKFVGVTRVYETNNNTVFPVATIAPFDYMSFPFPYTNSGTFVLPYIKFDSQGKCANGDYIPLTRGSVFYFADSQTTSIIETPPGESTNNYNLIHIDTMTGRARLERKEIK